MIKVRDVRVFIDEIGRFIERVFRIFARNAVIRVIGTCNVKVRIKDQNTVLCGFIDGGGVAQLFIGFALFGDVLHHADKTARSKMFVDKQFAAGADPADFVVIVNSLEHDIIKITMFDGVIERLFNGAAVFGDHAVKEGFQAFGDGFGTRSHAKMPDARTLHFLGMNINFPAAHLGGGHRQRQALLGFAKRNFGFAPFQCHLNGGVQFTFRKRLKQKAVRAGLLGAGQG